VTTDQKGAIAELAIALAALKLGVDVYRPVAEYGRYDLIFEVGGRLLRVQCKWAALCGDILSVRCYSARRGAGGKLINRPYSSADVDVFGAYSADLDRCFLLPPDLWEDRRLVSLRLAPTRNNQLRGINWARDFEIAATLRSFGAIAQLGERRHGMPKVTGSSPVGSIIDRGSPPLRRGMTNSIDVSS
jgi:hypothetical protein